MIEANCFSPPASHLIWDESFPCLNLSQLQEEEECTLLGKTSLIASNRAHYVDPGYRFLGNIFI